MACSAWIQEVVAQYLANGRYESMCRASAPPTCLRLMRWPSASRELDGRVRFSKPEGGMFFWARLTEIDATRLLLRHRHEVVYVPGKAFYADAAPEPTCTPCACPSPP